MEGRARPHRTGECSSVAGRACGPSDKATSPLVLCRPAVDMWGGSPRGHWDVLPEKPAGLGRECPLRTAGHVRGDPGQGAPRGCRAGWGAGPGASPESLSHGALPRDEVAAWAFPAGREATQPGRGAVSWAVAEAAASKGRQGARGPSPAPPLRSLLFPPQHLRPSLV